MRWIVWFGLAFIIVAGAIWLNNTNLWTSPETSRTPLAHRRRRQALFSLAAACVGSLF
jgi:hypothetical protein